MRKIEFEQCRGGKPVSVIRRITPKAVKSAKKNLNKARKVWETEYPTERARKGAPRWQSKTETRKSTKGHRFKQKVWFKKPERKLPCVHRFRLF